MKLPHAAGPLVLIGGAEDKFFARVILRRLVELAGGPRAHIVVIPTASSVPRELGGEYQRAFEDIGVAAVDLLDVRTRADANNPHIVARVRAASAVMFTGGNQLRLTQNLGGTELLAAIQERHRAGVVVGGTSAGASALSNPMIYEGSAQDALHKGKVKLTQGLGLCEGIIVDTHFVKRGRIGRLLQTVTMNPALLGLGLGEDTGVVYMPDGVLDCVGSGHVVIVDGHHVGYTNVTDIESDEPMAVEHMVVHVLVAGCGFDLTTRRYLTPPTLADALGSSRGDVHRDARGDAFGGALARAGEQNSTDTEGATQDSSDDAT